MTNSPMPAQPSQELDDLMQRIKLALNERSPVSQIMEPVKSPAVSQGVPDVKAAVPSVPESLAAQADLNEMIMAVLQNFFNQLTRMEREIEFLRSETLRLQEQHQAHASSQSKPESNGKHAENHS